VPVELEVEVMVELVAVRSVDGTDVESAVEVLDPMLAVPEDRLAAVDEAVALDVKVFTADKVLDTAERVVIEVPDATAVGVVADPVAAGDDSAPLGELGADWVADLVLLTALALAAELGAGLGSGVTLLCGGVEVPTGTTTVFEDVVASETLCGDDAVAEVSAEEATGTTKLRSVVESAAEGETESTELALVSIDESADAALERADVTIAPGAVSVMVMAIV
jgi:hypothetical protein